MPTNKKIDSVENMAEWMAGYEMLVSTDYTDMSSNDMNQMRKVFRENSVQYTIIKNTLAHLAAEKSGKPIIKEIVEGPTGIAYGSGDPVSIAKTVTEFITTSRLPLKIRGGIMDDTLLSVEDLEKLVQQKTNLRYRNKRNKPIPEKCFKEETDCHKSSKEKKE